MSAPVRPMDPPPGRAPLTPLEKRYSFEIRHLFSTSSWGVMATLDDVRDLGIDYHWLTRAAAEEAMRYYLRYPARHGKATEREIRIGLAAVRSLGLVLQ